MWSSSRAGTIFFFFFFPYGGNAILWRCVIRKSRVCVLLKTKDIFFRIYQKIKKKIKKIISALQFYYLVYFCYFTQLTVILYNLSYTQLCNITILFGSYQAAS